MKKTTASSIYIAWNAFQRRQVSMADNACFECVFLPIAARSRTGKAFAYIWLLLQTMRLLRERQPETVWVQLPQLPALWAAIAYRAFAVKPVKIIADCHNAQLRKPWSHFPFTLWSLKRADAILVHNETMLGEARTIGWPMDKVLVLEDAPAMGKDKPPAGIAARYIVAPKPWIVFPGSFAADEPIQEILEAAQIASDFTFIITGRPSKAAQNGHSIDTLPKNVVLTGFLSVDIFDDLLREADVVIGLTREEGIQLSVCNEALGFGRPLVTSDTKILRKLFGAAAVLVDTKNPTSIAAGCRAAVRNADEYANKSRDLAVVRIKKWDSEQLGHLALVLKIQ